MLRSRTHGRDEAEGEDTVLTVLASLDRIIHKPSVHTNLIHVAQVPQQCEVTKLTLSQQPNPSLALVCATGQGYFPGIRGHQLTLHSPSPKLSLGLGLGLSPSQADHISQVVSCVVFAILGETIFIEL